MNITNQRLQQILSDAPAGTTKEGIIAALRSKGHTIEGYDAIDTTGGLAQVGAIPREPAQKTSMGKVGGFIDWMGRTFTPLLGTAVRTTQLPLYEKTQRELTESYEKLGKELITRLKDPDIPREQKERAYKAFVEAQPEVMKAHPDIEKTAKQVLGEAVVTATTIALAGAPKMALPFARGVGVRETAIAATRAAGIGAAFGAGQAMIEDLPTEDIVKRAGTSAVLAVALESMVGGASRGLSRMATRWRNNIIKYHGQPELAGRNLLRKNLIGTANRMQKTVVKDVTKLEGQIAGLMKGQKRKISWGTVVRNAVEMEKKRFPVGPTLIDEALAAKGFNKALQKVSRALKLSPSRRLTVSQLNNLRKQIDDQVLSKDMMRTWAQLPDVKNRLMLLSQSLQKVVGAEVPATVNLFDRLTYATASHQAMTNFIRAEVEGKFLSFTNIISGTLVGAPWFLMNRPDLAVMTALGAVSIRSPILKQNLATITKLLGQYFGRSLTGPERALIHRLITK